MKYSFLSFSCPELSLDELLATAREHGYDGIEPRLDRGHRHGVETAATPAQRMEIKNKAKAAGISFSCLATSCVFADPQQTGKNIDAALKAVELAGDIGAPCVRVFGGRIPKEISREKAVEIVAEALASIAVYAEKRGVTLCLETHDHWCDPGHVAAVLSRVDHPAAAANWDVMHPVRVAHVTMDQAFAALKPWIRHVHVHDGVTKEGQLSLVPIGTGEIDHKRAIALLKTIAYDGFISGEWSGWSDKYDVYLPRELAALKKYESGV